MILFGKTLSELEHIVQDFGEPKFRAKQICDWLYKKQVASYDDMKNINKALREKLAAAFTLGISNPIKEAKSKDGTSKFLFCHESGKFIETAYIPDRERATLCVSSQIGCKMLCQFCATGRQGFQGHLTAGDIINQYRSIPYRESVTNFVFMGMGEPFDNYDEVIKAIEILTSDYGYGLSPSRITVSTIGLLPGIEKFLVDTKANLAISMHSPFHEQRQEIMPVERVYPIEEVVDYLRKNPMNFHRKLSFEYIVFGDLNDTKAHAKKMLTLLQGVKCKVNLIPFHPVPGALYKPADRTAMEEFQAILKKGGIMTTIRTSRGMDIDAACGMLSTKELNRQKNSK